MTASPARAVELPKLSADETLVYLRAYGAAKEQGKSSRQASKAGLAAVKRQRKAQGQS